MFFTNTDALFITNIDVKSFNIRDAFLVYKIKGKRILPYIHDIKRIKNSVFQPYVQDIKGKRCCGFRLSCSRYKKHVREIKGKLHCCFFPFISQTYSPLFPCFSARFFLLYRKQACSAPFHVFLLFLKQACLVFLLYPKQVCFVSVRFSFYILHKRV